MHGIVAEWCQDVYDEKAYSKLGELTVDPLVTSGSDSRVLRVTRGGSWHSGESDCRSSFRERNSPSNRSDEFGFRVVCELP